MIRKRCNANVSKRTRRMIATATAFTFLCQNFAWAVCADGTTFPALGYVNGQPPAANWAFDQGTTTCKEIDLGLAGTPTGWVIPTANNGRDCIFLPRITGTAGNPPVPIIKDFSDIPFQGQAITPTCNPALLSQLGAPNPSNTRLNQLGCAISHGVATTPHTATTFLFVAVIPILQRLPQSGLFVVQL